MTKIKHSQQLLNKLEVYIIYQCVYHHFELLVVIAQISINECYNDRNTNVFLFDHATENFKSRKKDCVVHVQCMFQFATNEKKRANSMI